MAFLQQHVPMMEDWMFNGNAATSTVVGENTLEPASSVTPRSIAAFQVLERVQLISE
jgi:hypothetical protein